MFTGLIEAIGTVASVQSVDGGFRIRIQTALAEALAPGDSLAVNGVCLTVTERGNENLSADIGPETARVTTLGGLRSGRVVNLERPLAGDGRFGGHFVQGHVDGVGRLQSVRPEGEAHWLEIGFEPAAAPHLIPRGSIAVDGVSLTVAGLTAGTFSVMIIPFTWSHTNLSALEPGAPVNLEFDMVGKYVARAVELALQERLKSPK